ncbi:Ldh family oxidoreductase [Secundilactobacillus collinoides]|uniref:Malate dehydrogenase n=2 Tax=Secundilactobacillus collinoides TaxID=33960 RepID=A0A161VGK0_SECCO|nr:Ldh family oxidoreductase [Secundilactobacillus collinoides]KRM77808.1 putative malate dehydrogenase (putative) [Secundilactobacillus collinoides DSM 20515 = JCM 1123]KZL38292.1 malate dehydrogenase [Secundilactobacillus collinoides]
MVERYDSDKIKELVFKIYQGYGFTDDQAHKVAETLIYTDLHGIQSHGVQRMFMYDHFITNGKIRVQSRPEIVKETPVSAVVDANFGLGQLNGIYSMDLAIKKAKESGIGIVTTRHSGHYGIAGYYANMAAEQGLIGMSSCNSRPAMLPTFSMQAFVGTNPIAFAMPANPHNYIFDAATTTVPQGKVEVYRKLGKDLPALWVAKDGQTPVYDHNDNETLDKTRDPKAYVGLAPLGGVTEETGGHKGFGLAVMVEVFTSILSMGDTSAEISAEDTSVGPAQSFIAIDPSIFGDKDAIIEKFSDYLQQIRELPAVPGKTIYVAGDKEALAYDDRKTNGIIIDDHTLEEVTDIAKRLGIDYEQYVK